MKNTSSDNDDDDQSDYNLVTCKMKPKIRC